MRHQAPVGFLAQQLAFPSRDNQQPSVVQPVDRERDRARDADHDLAVAVAIHGDDLLRAPVRKPQPAVMPAWRLADHQTCEKRA